jgi:hypothetical protein
MLNFGMDLTPLVGMRPSIRRLSRAAIRRFSAEVNARLAKLS